MAVAPSEIQIPSSLLPADGRFGCGPSKVRPEQVSALAAASVGTEYLGTSHRQARVRFEVGALRNGLAELFALPDGYEVLLGNGGTTAFWDAASFGLVEARSQHLRFGEFSSKFAEVCAAAPHLSEPSYVWADPGSHPWPVADPDVDAYALTHNETSTGVAMPISRVPDADDGSLVLVDATSAAAGVRVDLAECDVYYFAPQKCLASDGGLWLACVSPAAVERIERLAASGRWCPAFLDLRIALEQSRLDQTYNTPALATILLAKEQVEWINGNGGLAWSAARCAQSSGLLYEWADAHEHVTPFVSDPAMRSPVVATLDLAERFDAVLVSQILRANGIVDTESYRKLGRNQLRIACFPAIDPEDVQQLITSIDHILAELA